MTFERMINRVASYPFPLHYFFLNKVRKMYYRFFPYSAYFNQILSGCVDRPWYGYCIYEAARLASRLGHSRMSVIEFGVAGGNGLLNIESHAQKIQKEFNIEIEIYGFDMESGLPDSNDFRDCLYDWKPGSFAMDRSKLESKLRVSKLIIGDVSRTSGTFFQEYNPAPIGCIMFDLDYYSSTKNAFKILENASSRYLPRVNCYFDDINLTNEFVGELCAIKEFNHAHEKRKIGQVYNFGERIFTNWPGWLMCGNKIFQLHCFDHLDYNKPLSGDSQLPLNG